MTNKQNEAKELRNNLRLYGNNYTILEDSLEVYNDIKNNINIIKQYERPDMYINLENLAIGIENFKFSSYQTNKDGDKCIEEQEMFYKNNENKFLKDKKMLYDDKTINTQKNMQFYEDNFIKVFTKHYNNISEYKNKLKKFSNNVKLYFNIVDETMEKNEIEINDRKVLFNFYMNEKILNFLKNKTDIDGIIYQCNDVGKIKFYYLKINANNIESLLKKNKKYFNKELLERNVKMINFFGGF